MIITEVICETPTHTNRRAGTVANLMQCLGINPFCLTFKKGLIKAFRIRKPASYFNMV